MTTYESALLLTRRSWLPATTTRVIDDPQIRWRVIDSARRHARDDADAEAVERAARAVRAYVRDGERH